MVSMDLEGGRWKFWITCLNIEIERDSFDFKGPKLQKHETHLCAMANTVTGILALGVLQRYQNVSSDIKTIINYRLSPNCLALLKHSVAS